MPPHLCHLDRSEALFPEQSRRGSGETPVLVFAVAVAFLVVIPTLSAAEWGGTCFSPVLSPHAKTFSPSTPSPVSCLHPIAEPQMTKLILILSLALPLTAQAQDPKSSTLEERQQWARTLHQLEADPQDQPTKDEAGRDIIRLIEVSDLHITMCDAMRELPEENYQFKQSILQLFMLGLAVYQVETGKTDNPGSNLYAFHSVLKGYSSLLQKDPTSRNKKLDVLVELDKDGKLPDLIRKKKGCK